MDYSNDDITQPVSESYLHLSQDPIDDITDTSVKINESFEETKLINLAKKIDKLIDSNRDRTPRNYNAANIDGFDDDDDDDDDSVALVDLDEDEMIQKPFISSQSTPIPERYPSNRKRASENKITYKQLSNLIQPLINEEFKGIESSIKELLREKSKKFHQSDNKLSTIGEVVKDSSSDNCSDFDDDRKIADNNGNNNGNNDNQVDNVSPVTTPPSSQDNIKSNNLDFDSNYITKNDIQGNNNEIELLKEQIEHLKFTSNEMFKENTKLRLKLEQSSKSNTSQELNQLKLLNNQLTIKLNESKSYNKELRNEIDYLKHNDNVNELISEINRLNKEIGNQNEQFNVNSLDKEFRLFYDKLNLYKIDQMTKFEMSNLIKNLLLTLLIDFNDLPTKVIKLSKFLKLSSQFMDNQHQLLYINHEIKPSFYLKNNGKNDLDDFSSCLNGMYEIIKHSLNN